jgi:hypothetical protein
MQNRKASRKSRSPPNRPVGERSLAAARLFACSARPPVQDPVKGRQRAQIGPTPIASFFESELCYIAFTFRRA